MNSKRKTAMSFLIVIAILVLFVAAALLFGAVRITVLMDNPLNIVSLLIAAIACAFAVAMAVMMVLQHRSRCQNINCAKHPAHVEETDSFFKETTGLIDMHTVFEAQAAEEVQGQCSLQLVDDTSEQRRQTPAEAAVSQELELPAKKALMAPVEAVQLQQNPHTVQELVQEPMQEPVQESLVADITIEEIFGSHLLTPEPVRDESAMQVATFSDVDSADDDVEEPIDKPSMDFTDDMIPLIIQALQKAQMAAKEEARILAERAYERAHQLAVRRANELAASPIDRASLLGRYHAAAVPIKSEFNSKSAAIEWLFKDQQPRQGRHFRAVKSLQIHTA